MSSPFDQYYAGGSFRGTLYGDTGEDTDVASVCTVDDLPSGFQQGAASSSRNTVLETRSEQNEDVRQFNALTDSTNRYRNRNHDDDDDDDDDDSSGSGSSRNDHEVDVGSILTEEYSMMDTRYPASSRAASPSCDGDVMSLATKQQPDMYLEAMSHAHARIPSEYTIEFYSEDDDDDDDVEQPHADHDAVHTSKPHATFIATADNGDDKKTKASSSPNQVWLSRKRRFLVVVFLMAALVGAAIGVFMLLQNDTAGEEGSAGTSSSTVDQDTSIVAAPPPPPPGYADKPTATTPIVQYKVFESRIELEEAVDSSLEIIGNKGGKSSDIAVDSVVAKKYGYPIGSWKLSSNVTDLSFLFAATRNPHAAFFNEPLDDWDVKSVTSMNSMFYDASSFNQPLSSWDIAAVTDLSNMLSGAAAFRQDLCPWARRLHPNADTLNVFRGTNCPQEQDDDMEFFLSSTTSFCFSCPAQAGGNDANSTNNSTGTIGDPGEEELAPTPAPTRQDLYGVILGREDLLTLQNALVEASMIETLSRQQGAVHTVFAPTNDAFLALPTNLFNKLTTQPKWRTHLKHLLRHHMVSGQMWTANQLSDGQTLTMRSGETVNVVKKTNTSSTNTTGMTTGSSITLDGSVSITVADLRADNGVVHVVNGLLRPDFLSRSVMGVTEQMKTTSVFASLLELTGLADELENLDAEFTVFAPTNGAFEALDLNTLSFLQSLEGRYILIQTLRQHIVSSIVSTASATNGTYVATSLADTELSLDTDSSGNIMVRNNIFTDSDILASNGIVHTIETVMLHQNVSELTSQFCGFLCPSNSTTIVNDRQCYTSFSDCQCDLGFLNQGDECVFCNYTCPTNSTIIANELQCYTSFDDCQCDEGLVKQGDECQFCSFTCPSNSTIIANELQCYSSFADCQCDEGLVKQGEECVLASCDYSCPSNSTPIADELQCPTSFAECQCDLGFVMRGDECIFCSFACPENSQPTLEGLVCSSSFDNCECATGYAKEGAACVFNLTTACEYTCPINSAPREGLDCLTGAIDCVCSEGLVMEGEECVSLNQTAVCGYTCPSNSSPQTGLNCATRFGDCDCDAGFTRRQSRCIACDYECPARSSRIPSRECYASFDDCQCNAGYSERGGTCILVLDQIP